jgi:hypothetical protein
VGHRKIQVLSFAAATLITPSTAIVTVAFAIFVVDVFIDVEIAIPVLYVAVVLMSVRLY